MLENFPMINSLAFGLNHDSGIKPLSNVGLFFLSPLNIMLFKVKIPILYAY